MTHINNTTTPSTVRDDGHTTAAGTRISADEVRAADVARQAEAFLDLASQRTRLAHGTLVLKAITATAFSVRVGAASLALPTKAVSVLDHQARLWSMSRALVRPWTPLGFVDTGDGLALLHDGEPVGEVAPKWVQLVRALTPHGAAPYLVRVTGGPRWRLGLNYCWGHVGVSIDRLTEAAASEAAATETAVGTHGDGQATAVPSALRLVTRRGVSVLPEHAALDPDADPADVVLWRSIEGTAHASVEHVRRHSPSGLEWGFGGSGPADLALSVLTAVVGSEAAERGYQAFKSEVVGRVPYAGGVLRAADVRAWAEGREPGGC